MHLHGDWSTWHALAAAVQGWRLSETGFNHHSTIEVRCLEPGEPYAELGIELDGDERAVDALRDAFSNGQDHAMLAYNLIKSHSPSEFHHWDMASWR